MSVYQSIGLTPGQKVWICPYSHLSEKLAETLVLEGLDILGFIDKGKTGNNIINYETLSVHSTEKVLVLSPNHGCDIYQSLVEQGISSKALRLLRVSAHTKQQFSLVSPLYLRFKNTLTRLLYFLYQHAYLSLANLLKDEHQALFISSGFIDLNVKDLYLDLEAHTAIKPRIATDNHNQLKQLKQAGFNTTRLNSLAYIYRSLRANIKILDHTPANRWQDLILKNSFSVQIWHGIPLKKIGHLANYKRITYDIVVSTSAFVSRYAFKTLFSAKSIIECGYPRNDMLTESDKPAYKQDKRLALVNRPIYNWLLKQNKTLLVYMPTWRQPGAEKNPLNLDELNQFAKKENLLVLIKNHPFIRSNTFYNCFNEGKNQNCYHFFEGFSENILFYPSTDDIYPLLAKSQALITDYSSVYFDYLLLNKPIIFFCYDRKHYENKHGEFMLDFDTNTPGEKAHNPDELQTAIMKALSEDHFQNSREALRNKLFSCENIGCSGVQLARLIANHSSTPPKCLTGVNT